MAVELSATGVYELRLTFEDYGGEEATKVLVLDGATTDANLINIVTYLDTITNSKIVTAKVSKLRSFSGMAANASDTVQSKISVEAFLAFLMEDPLNSTKTVSKTASIPAYDTGIEDPVTHKPKAVLTADGGTSVQNALSLLITLLEASLVYVDTRPFPSTINSGFAYTSVNSGFGSVMREFDTRPGV